jgi:hypothetical protein
MILLLLEKRYYPDYIPESETKIPIKSESHGKISYRRLNIWLANNKISYQNIIPKVKYLAGKRDVSWIVFSLKYHKISYRRLNIWLAKGMYRG